jgi:WXXGXW repeat (2 copies)
MKIKFLALLLLAGSSMFGATRVFFGVGVGGGYYPPPPVYAYAPPPPPVYAYVPPAPGPGYSWVAGYWAPVGPRWTWRPGYWAARPFAGAVWVGPRYYGHRHYPGYWRR